MAEDLRRKHGDRDERATASINQRRVVRERQLRDVELLVAQHPPEDLRRLAGDIRQLDAVRLDRAILEAKRPIVRPARQRQLEVRHGDHSIRTFSAKSNEPGPCYWRIADGPGAALR